MPVTDFGAMTVDGKPIPRAELREKLPISSELIDRINRNDDVSEILSALASAIMLLEARGVEFED
jgi:hypothetical protein